MPATSTGVLEPSLSAEREARSSCAVHIRRVGVLGAGTMGARIAAHVANAGVPVLLLDMTSSTGDRNSLAAQAVTILSAARPAAFAAPSLAALITVGNFDDDLPNLKTCDWVIEAVAENLEIKRALLAKVALQLGPHTILTTNTSGLPVARIAEQLPEEVRRRWFGTHFFNPPRYMRLMEVIPTPDSDPGAVRTVSEFAERALGKTVVPAKDVQNFIANRIGTFAMLNTFKIMEEQKLSIEEIDALTGSVIGWPKTGTFRLADMVGLDVLANVARNFKASVSDERSDLDVPEVIAKLIERKSLGDKTGRGFYKKERRPDGSDLRLVLDSATLEYRPAAKVSLPSLDQVKGTESLSKRLRALLAGDPAKDKAARFYRKFLPELWAYAANRIGEVSDTLVEIDRAMEAGFNWEMGPFALCDAAGVHSVLEIMQGSGMPVPDAAQRLLASGDSSWYGKDGTEFFDLRSGTYEPIEEKKQLASIATYRRSNGVFSGNSAISLMDVGEGVGCFEIHSKMNTIGQDIVTFLIKNLDPDSEAVRNFEGFVIATDAPNFSAGANLMQLLLAVQDDEWDDIRAMVDQFQAMTQAVKFCIRPVVAAAAGMCLGGGTEIALHSAARQAHLELYMGLVETGVGLIPGGGGCKEMLIRAVTAAQNVRSDARPDSVEVIDAIKSAFESIAMAKVSSSAIEARTLRLLKNSDAISMNRNRLLNDAKSQVLRTMQTGYVRPVPRTDIPAPGSSVFATLKLGIYLMREGDYISDHDVKVATHVAQILSGGDVTPGRLLSENDLLGLEKEAFLSLCGEPKTLERIGYTLKTGKPLRN